MVVGQAKTYFRQMDVSWVGLGTIEDYKYLFVMKQSCGKLFEVGHRGYPFCNQFPWLEIHWTVIKNILGHVSFRPGVIFSKPVKDIVVTLPIFD